MSTFQKFQAWGAQNLDIAYEVIRLYLGIGLFVKGIHFVLNDGYLVDLLITAGHLEFAGTVVAHLVGFGHLCGGAFLAAGLITRTAALIQLPILAGALVFVSVPQGLFTVGQSFEFTALVFFLLLLFAIFGGGRWSMDRNIMQKRFTSRAESVSER